MNIFKNFSALFVEVWEKGILGVDIFQILIGLGIFLIFLLFRVFISKIIINRLKKIARQSGYHNTLSAGGTVNALKNLIINSNQINEKSKIAYFCGDNVA